MGDDVDDDEGAVGGRDRVAIPRFLVPSLEVDTATRFLIDRRRWPDPIEAKNREQVILIYCIS